MVEFVGERKVRILTREFEADDFGEVLAALEVVLDVALNSGAVPPLLGLMQIGCGRENVFARYFPELNSSREELTVRTGTSLRCCRRLWPVRLPASLCRRHRIGSPLMELSHNRIVRAYLTKSHVPGHAGLFSTALDLANFGTMMSCPA